MKKIGTINYLTDMSTEDQHLHHSEMPDLAHMSTDEYEEYLCAEINKERVEPTYGIDCPLCGNKQTILRWDRKTQSRYSRQCACAAQRESIRRIDASGVCRDWRDKTFDSFQTADEWQQKMKAEVMSYVEAKDHPWLYLSGQSGCGKTHLCTAAFTELIRRSRGKSVYVSWTDLVQKLEPARFQEERYEAIVRPLMQSDLLYLDDFFKRRDGSQVTSYLFNCIMNIINQRYQNHDQITIFSSEQSLKDMIGYDEALAGRIKERCGNHVFHVSRKIERDYRLRGLV